MYRKILFDDWSDYDLRKSIHDNPVFFNFNIPWEKKYLVDKIQKHYPQFLIEDIQCAMRMAVNQRPTDMQINREKYLENVMIWLKRH